MFDAIASPSLGERPKANSPSNYEILQFRLLGALESGFSSAQGFPDESSSHILYKVLYVNSFYSLYCYHHYDDYILNAVMLYYMQTWSCLSV